MSNPFNQKPPTPRPPNTIEAVSDLGITILGVSVVILALVGLSAFVGALVRPFL